MKEQIGPRALLARLKRNLGPYSEEIPELPLLAYRVLNRLERQSLTVQWRSDELEKIYIEVRRHHNRTQCIILGIGLILFGVFLLALGHIHYSEHLANPVIPIGLLLLGIFSITKGLR